MGHGAAHRALVGAGRGDLRLDGGRDARAPLADSPLATRRTGRPRAHDPRPHGRPRATRPAPPQLPQGRLGDLGRVAQLGAARRGRPRDLDPVARAGRLLAHPGRGAPAVHGDARRAHGAAQQRAAERPPRRGALARAPRAPPRGRDVPRPRPLQGRERHARPPRGRPAAEGGRARIRAALRQSDAARAHLRRRVRGGARGPRRRRRAERVARKILEEVRAALPGRGPRDPRERQPRPRALSRGRRATPRRCSRTPTRRCTTRRSSAATASQFFSAELARRGARTACRSRRRCAARSRATSSRCTSSRSWTWRPARCAGAEALLRWQRSGARPRAAAGFIPLAEETGLGHASATGCCEAACKQARAWRDAGWATSRCA